MTELNQHSNNTQFPKYIYLFIKFGLKSSPGIFHLNDGGQLYGGMKPDSARWKPATILGCWLIQYKRAIHFIIIIGHIHEEGYRRYLDAPSLSTFIGTILCEKQKKLRVDTLNWITLTPKVLLLSLWDWLKSTNSYLKIATSTWNLKKCASCKV